MRVLASAVAMALMISVGCAEKSKTQASGSGSAPTPASTPASAGASSGSQAATAPPAAAQGGRGAGPQAAARMTPEQLDAAMKTISATNGTLGMKLMASDLPGAAKDAQTLATTFADVERFWAQANKNDAVMLARQARMAASEVAAAATAGDGMKAAAARSNMTATCKQCHGVYREGDAQTGYRIKAGVLP